MILTTLLNKAQIILLPYFVRHTCYSGNWILLAEEMCGSNLYIIYLETSTAEAMERAKQLLQLTKDESERMSLATNPHEFLVGPSFYEDVAFRGIIVNQVEPSMVVCTFKVPPRLIDRAGNLAAGAITTLMDIVTHALIHRLGKPLNASINMSVLYSSNAKLHDVLEIASTLQGRIGAVSGISIVIKNKASGKIVAEGQHSLLNRLHSKI